MCENRADREECIIPSFFESDVWVVVLVENTCGTRISIGLYGKEYTVMCKLTQAVVLGITVGSIWHLGLCRQVIQPV